MSENSVLIVGGAGYFGARLAEALVAERLVTITYRSLSSARKTWLESVGVTADAFDSARHSTLPIIKGFDAVVNLAMPSASQASIEPLGTRAEAIKTVDAALALLSEGRARRLVHFSSFHVYGSGGAPDYKEDTALRPTSPYGETHALVEERIYAHPCAHKVTVFRPTNIVGVPGHTDIGTQSGLIFLDLCRQAVGGRIVLRNDGFSYRDLLAIPDAIAAVRLALDSKGFGGKIFNLAAGKSTRLDALAFAIAASTTAEVIFGQEKDLLREPFNVSVDRLRSAGWCPADDFRLEIANTLKFFH